MSGTITAAAGEDGSGAPPGAGDNDGADPVVEARARRMGWRSRDEYKGRNNWLPADEFVERAEKVLPLLQERNRHMDAELQRVTTELAETRATVTDLASMARRSETVGYKRAIRELNARKTEAIQSGDPAAVRAVEAEIEELGPEPKAQETPKPVNPTAANAAADEAVVSSWRRDNRWFDADMDAQQASIGFLNVVKKERPNDTLEEQLVEVTRKVRRRFPELFDDAGGDGGDPPPPAGQRNRRPPAVSPSSNQGGGRQQAKPGTFDALPAEAKQAYERQAKALEGKGKPFSKEEYATYYFEGEE